MPATLEDGAFQLLGPAAGDTRQASPGTVAYFHAKETETIGGAVSLVFFRLSAAFLLRDIERVKLDDVWSYVLSQNVLRRHLTLGQKAMIAAQKLQICNLSGVQVLH